MAKHKSVATAGCILMAGLLIASIALAAGKYWAVPDDVGKTLKFTVGGRTSDSHQAQSKQSGNLTISVANDGSGVPGVTNTISLRIPDIGYKVTIQPGKDEYKGVPITANKPLGFVIDNENNALATNYRVLLGFATGK